MPFGKHSPLTCLVEFDGIITGQLRGNIVTEMLKYVLYQRQQIPQTYEQLKQQEQSKQDKQQEGETLQLKRKGPQKLQVRKLTEALENIEALFHNINQAFSNVNYINQVVITLGGTPISPKETYIIKLPGGVFEGSILSKKEVIQTLFRTLISQDLLGDFRNMSPTNSYVLLQAPRNSEMQWFEPKAAYKLPNRGKIIEVSLVCNQGSNALEADLTNVSSSDFEISGISPLEISTVSTEGTLCNSLNDMSINDSSFASQDVDKEVSPNSPDAMTTSDVEGHDSEFIWYQAPVSVRGFRDKRASAKMSSCMDIWA